MRALVASLQQISMEPLCITIKAVSSWRRWCSELACYYTSIYIPWYISKSGFCFQKCVSSVVSRCSLSKPSFLLLRTLHSSIILTIHTIWAGKPTWSTNTQTSSTQRCEVEKRLTLALWVGLGRKQQQKIYTWNSYSRKKWLLCVRTFQKYYSVVNIFKLYSQLPHVNYFVPFVFPFLKKKIFPGRVWSLWLGRFDRSHSIVKRWKMDQLL